MRRSLSFASTAGLALAMALAPVAVPTAWAHAPGTTYYIDCAAGDDAASGTNPGHAWRTLARPGGTVLQPGDRIALRAGTVCDGVLAPKGSGTARDPIAITRYGGGARPKIVGTGERAAVLLENVQGWEISGLDVANPGTGARARAGIEVRLADYGVGEHYVVRDTVVHDVAGCDCNASGGIVFSAEGETVRTGFDGVRVQGNDVSAVDGVGIGTFSTWTKREQYPNGTAPYVPMEHVRITGNRLHAIRGHGISVGNGASPLIDRNRVDGFSYGSYTAHLGIFAWNSDSPTVEHNAVLDGTGLFAAALGVEAASSDVRVQYNFTRRNHGGFVWVCSDANNPVDGASIRYNISQDDENAVLGTTTVPLISVCPGSVDSGVSFTGNTVRSEKGTALVQMLDTTVRTFRNNVFAGGPGGLTIADAHGVYEHNLYSNVTARPADAGAVVGDPGFAGAGFRLACGSPALRAGVTVPEALGRDFFGNPVGTPPHIGAYQGPCVSSR